jgi:immune inhibitor A
MTSGQDNGRNTVLVAVTFLCSLALTVLSVGEPTAMPLRPDVRDRLFPPVGTQAAGTTPGEVVSGGVYGSEWVKELLSPARMSASGIDVLPKQCRLGLPEGGRRPRTQLKALVLLVQFPDLAADGGIHGPQYYSSLLFGRPAWDARNLRKFYLENSYGTLDIDGEAYGWFTLPNPSDFYARASAGICDTCYPRNARRMAEDAVELARPLVDFSRFDNDGPDGIPSSGDDDGYVDALYIVHAGPTYEDTGNPSFVMSHQWTTAAPVPVDGVYAFVYTTEGELSKLGTFCHETGHVLGLPDLYDRDYTSYGLDLWSLMAAGGWVDEGDTPAHLDAYCKMKLGFLDIIQPESNPGGLTLRPIETYPEAYKLWKNGIAGKEYYLLEDRQQIGFDQRLPGSGLLVYHVDETAGDNDDESRYIVGLEQADGLFELEQLESGEAFAADPGDPFPGWSYNRNFSLFTVPSSRSNDGQDVQVAITYIDDPAGLVTFDGTIETTFNAVVSRVLTDDSEGGDGDGNADKGENARLLCEFTNVGLPSGRLFASVSTGNIYVTVAGDTVTYDYLAEDEARLPEGGFAFRVDSLLDRDPLRAYFIVTLTDGVFFSQKDTVAVPVGDSLGLRDDFENGVGDWTHRTFTEADDWHISTERSVSGESSWRCGIPGTAAYTGRQDSQLRTPVFISGARSRLSFLQWLDMESANSETAWDGAFVEVSRDNFYWHELEPVGGYPYVFDPRVGGEHARRGCFSGRGRQWEQVEFDLSDYSGTVWLRFRMVADGSVSGEGWYIDNVQVETVDEPYSITFVETSASPGDIQLKWSVEPRLSPYTGQGMALFRGDMGAVSEGDYNVYALVYQDPSSAPGQRAFSDTSVVSGRYYSYAIRDVNARGETRWIAGPRVYAPHSIPKFALVSCTPNPFAPSMGRMAVALDVPDVAGAPASQSARMLVYDVAGRVLKVLLEGRVVSGRTTIDWDGTDTDGKALPPGVYVVSFETAASHLTRKVVLIR